MKTIKIYGMTCGHCVAAVTKALQSAAGVTKVVEVDLESGEARVEGTPDPQSVSRVVELAGYRAEVVE